MKSIIIYLSLTNLLLKSLKSNPSQHNSKVHIINIIIIFITTV